MHPCTPSRSRDSVVGQRAGQTPPFFAHLNGTSVLRTDHRCATPGALAGRVRRGLAHRVLLRSVVGPPPGPLNGRTSTGRRAGPGGNVRRRARLIPRTPPSAVVRECPPEGDPPTTPTPRARPQRTPPNHRAALVPLEHAFRPHGRRFGRGSGRPRTSPGPCDLRPAAGGVVAAQTICSSAWAPSQTWGSMDTGRAF